MFGRLGHKKNHSPPRAGHKTTTRASILGAKAYDNVEQVASNAGTVENIAKKISGATATGATLAAMTGLGAPVAGALGSVSAVAGGVGQVAGMVKTGADRGAQAKGVYQRAMSFMG